MPTRTTKCCAALLCVYALTIASRAGAVCPDGPDEDTPASRYAISDSGEVHDTRTHLIWRRCSVGQRWAGELGCVGVIRQMNWEAAMRASPAGWRLPSKDELSTLVSAACKNPAINEEVFPDMELTKLWYWTRSESGAAAWYVAFGGGTARIGTRTQLNAVRLVRSASRAGDGHAARFVEGRKGE